MIFKEGLDMTVEERIGELESQVKELQRKSNVQWIAIILLGITTMILGITTIILGSS